MRAFLGIPIPEELKPKILGVQKRFSSFNMKLVEPENLHFNLKFFKKIQNEEVEKLKQILGEISKKFEPFEMEIKGLDVFPSKNYIRVVWLGVKEGYNMIKSLAETIQDSIEVLGFFGKRKFTPHLTLGRVRSGRNKGELITLIDQLEDIEIGKMKVDKIILFRSKLSPKGPIYEEVFDIKL